MKWLRRLFQSPQPSTAPPRPAKASRPSPVRVKPARREPDWRSYDYPGVAGGYVRVVARLTAEPAADLMAMIDSAPGARVLDVGTGGGLTAGATAGVDASVALLLEGKKQDPARPLAAAKIIDLPFREGTFDAVIANFVLPYVTKLDTALHDIIRVVKPGGRIGVTVWTEVLDDLTRTWHALATEVLGPEMFRDAVKQGTPWASRLADAKHLDQTLRDAGLRPVTVKAHRYRNELSREDYLVSREVEVIGRYVHRMLGEDRWRAFGERSRARFADRFGEQVVDFRDVLLAVGTKPE
ncbi:MAG TPA: methyltransferase domain-containing protein [Actinomycetota bacterium]